MVDGDDVAGHSNSVSGTNEVVVQSRHIHGGVHISTSPPVRRPRQLPLPIGTFTGREEIRDWSMRTMTSYPGRVMTGFPIGWQVVDASQSRLVCEVLNPMPDPGDGTMLVEPNITIMTYAGDGLFSGEEDVYNPLRFHAMAQRWARIAAEHGNADEDVLAWLDRFGGGR